MTADLKSHARLASETGDALRLLKAMADATPDAIAVKDADQVYRSVNAAFARLVARSEQEIVGKTDAHLFSACQAAQFQRDDRLVLETGTTATRDQYLYGAAPPRWVSASRSPLHRYDGTIDGLVMTLREVPRPPHGGDVRAETAHAITEVMVNERGEARDLRFLDLNRAFEDQLGRRRAEVVGRCLSEVLPQLDTLSLAILAGAAPGGEEVAVEHRSTPGTRFAITASSPGRGWCELVVRDDTAAAGATGDTGKRELQEALRASERLIRAVIDVFPGSIAIYDGQRRFKYVNNYASRITGVSLEGHIGRTDEEVRPPEMVRNYLPLLMAAYETRTSQSRKVALSLPDGTYTLALTYIPLLNDEGEVEQVLGVAHDTTEHEAAKELNRLQADRYATLLATSPDGVWSLDTDGNLLDVNDVYCRMSGYTREELLGLSLADLEAVEDPRGTAQRIRKIIAEGFDRFETRHRRKDGMILEVEVSASYWAATAQFLVFVRDISERALARMAANAERARFHALLDALPVYVVLLTPDYHVAFANRLFRERFGEAPGRRCYEHLFGRNAPCEICETYSVLKSKRLLTWEWSGPDGREYFIHDHPFVETDGGMYILEAGMDITDLKQAQSALHQVNADLERRVAERTAALEAANREMEAFSYAVSHDLRGPLRAINGFAEILNEEYGERLDDVGQSYLKRVRDAALRMSELIDGLLTLSRIVRADLACAPIDLSAVARELSGEIHEADPAREVVWQIDPDLRATGDPRLLRVMMQNLLDNAWKFTVAREVARISVGRQSRDGREVFYVRDNGLGFEPADAERLFLPFERLHGNGYEGNGIGLATVQRIVRRHNGAVWAEGEVNAGATIFFTLDATVERTP